MRLKVAQVSCFRGDRLVLDAVGFCGRRRAARWCWWARTAPANPRCCVCWRGSSGSMPAAIMFDGTSEYAGKRGLSRPSQDAIKPALTTALENLRFCGHGPADGDTQAALAGRGRARRALANLPARMLSAGQKRRLALARLAVLLGAALWLLDEPTVGLDTAAIARFERGPGRASRLQAAWWWPPRTCRCRCRGRRR